MSQMPMMASHVLTFIAAAALTAVALFAIGYIGYLILQMTGILKPKQSAHVISQDTFVLGLVKLSNLMTREDDHVILALASYETDRDAYIEERRSALVEAGIDISTLDSRGVFLYELTSRGYMTPCHWAFPLRQYLDALQAPFAHYGLHVADFDEMTDTVDTTAPDVMEKIGELLPQGLSLCLYHDKAGKEYSFLLQAEKVGTVIELARSLGEHIEAVAVPEREGEPQAPSEHAAEPSAQAPTYSKIIDDTESQTMDDREDEPEPAL